MPIVSKRQRIATCRLAILPICTAPSTALPLKHGLDLRKALRLALAADTASIATMELSDNAFILVVPGAINAGLNTALFWISLGISLVVAYAVAYPVNRSLISRGKGHAVVAEYHHGHHM